MVDAVIDLSKISAFVAIIFASAWVTVERGVDSGMLFMVLGFGLLIVLFVIYASWEEHKHMNGMR